MKFSVNVKNKAPCYSWFLSIAKEKPALFFDGLLIKVIIETIRYDNMTIERDQFIVQ